MEASRKHGSFDMRWPCASNDGRRQTPVASPLSAAEAKEALDWDSFSGRHFGGRRRHDAEARSAYARYKEGREWRTPPARLRLVPSELAPADQEEREEAGTRRLMDALAAVPARRRAGR
jgi:hypothetical protein